MLLLLAGVLAACSPVLDWREVALDEAGLKVLLPCKPDHGERDLPIGPAVLHLRMVGCEAGGSLFAVAHAAVPEGLASAEVVAAWRSAALAAMRAAPDAQEDDGRLTARGRRPDGRPVYAQAAWRVLADRAPAQVVQAVVYSAEPLAGDAADTFFGAVEPR
ncbi:hypothetical protein [Xylophilus sp.]|uniref:hypothetical protein n=1 Tax=Xylophilus sp. TaxID=2653893 RepID=UPI0013BBD25E|nr:hypothetical protein [Xylophilus sp.]KAF1044854.1 MAG: hypothetical protein GAK38_03326 [Xylophilus sp.]